MGGPAVRVILVLLIFVSASFGVSVSVASPANSSTVTSPVTISATAASNYPVTGWRIYVDGVSAYSAGAVKSIAAPVTMSLGTHQVVVRAWDSTGAYGSANLTLNVVTASTASGVTVNVAAPLNNATVASPAAFNASAVSGSAITGWRIYVDGTSVYSAGATSAISTSVPIASGTHQVVVRAWNAAGAYGSASLTLTAGGSSTTTGPVAPSNALVFSRLEDSSAWTKCSSASCSGGIAPAGTYWFAQHQSTPSLDGSSIEFFMSGPAYSTDLFGTKAGNNVGVSHFINDFWVYADQASLTAIEALEFDIFHVANSSKYMFGAECNYWTKTWDVWNEVTQRWIHSNATCQKFAPDTWHHVQWSVERVGYQLHYISVTVDGVTQNIADTYAYQPSAPTSWANGDIGIQVQQDLSSSPGVGSHLWVDKATVYAW